MLNVHNIFFNKRLIPYNQTYLYYNQDIINFLDIILVHTKQNINNSVTHKWKFIHLIKNIGNGCHIQVGLLYSNTGTSL
jgi:hypothetical protein